MKDLAAFTFSGDGRGGFGFAGAVICPAEKETELAQLAAGFAEYHASSDADPYDIDHRFAEFATRVCPDWICALGMSFRVPGAMGPAGGIIGSPRQVISSAAGTAEDLGNGLSVAALPGGPGVVIQGTPAQAARVSAAFSSAENGSTFAAKLTPRLRAERIELAIAVCDGSGPGMQGCALALNGAETLVSYLSDPCNVRHDAQQMAVCSAAISCRCRWACSPMLFCRGSREALGYHTLAVNTCLPAHPVPCLLLLCAHGRLQWPAHSGSSMPAPAIM